MLACLEAAATYRRRLWVCRRAADRVDLRLLRRAVRVPVLADAVPAIAVDLDVERAAVLAPAIGKFVSARFTSTRLGINGRRVHGPRGTGKRSVHGETLRTSVAKNESDGDPIASDDRVPDAPERPKMENAVINKREKHPPPRADCRRTRTLASSARPLRTMPKLLNRQSDRRQRRTARPNGVNSSNHLENLHRKGGGTSSTSQDREAEGAAREGGGTRRARPSCARRTRP